MHSMSVGDFAERNFAGFGATTRRQIGPISLREWDPSLGLLRLDPGELHDLAPLYPFHPRSFFRNQPETLVPAVPTLPSFPMHDARRIALRARLAA